MSVWHNDGSNDPTLENKTLKIYNVLEDLNYGLLKYMQSFERIYAKRTPRLSEELLISNDTIYRQTLGKSHRSYRSVPHELTPHQLNL